MERAARGHLVDMVAATTIHLGMPIASFGMILSMWLETTLSESGCRQAARGSSLMRRLMQPLKQHEEMHANERLILLRQTSQLSRCVA